MTQNLGKAQFFAPTFARIRPITYCLTCQYITRTLYVRPWGRHHNLPAFFLALLPTRYYIGTKNGPSHNAGPLAIIIKGMEKIQNPSSIIFGGICGIAGTILYILASFLPLQQNLLYVIAMSWPILSIIFVYSIYKYVALKHQTFANQLSFIFASLGFTIVACMISIQLAVKLGINEHISKASENYESFDLILKSIRLVDHGLDVAWDLFIGTSLLFLFAAIKGHSRFRLPWAIPALILGIVLIILNAYAFPWPPNTVGLIDIGPLIGLFIIAISGRLILLGLQLKRDMKNL